MKLFSLAAAGLVALTGLASVGVATEASAQRTVVHERTVVRHNGGYNRHRVTTRRVCKNVWRHGHRQRVCRTVRVRR